MTLRQPTQPGGGGGGVVLPIRTVTHGTGSKSITSADGILLLDASGGGFTMTMNPASIVPGYRDIIAVKVDASANQIGISDGIAQVARLLARGDSNSLTSLGASLLVT